MEKRLKTPTLKTTPKIVVISGAESTGKSTLTKALAEHYKVPFIPEIAREYVENLDREYNYQDVKKIAKKQIDQLNKIKNSNHRYIFIDTWLLNTKVWFEEVFEKKPKWLIAEILKTKVDLYLICDIDLPWVFDPVRENGGESRKLLHQKYIENIEYYNFEYKIIHGQNELRFQMALQILEDWEKNINKLRSSLF